MRGSRLGGNIYVVIVYDVAVERINGVRQLLRQYLTWVQNSAFEGELTEGELEKVKIELRKLIREDQDSILFYVVSSQKWIRKDVLGIEKAEVSTVI
jgi:CRISPR-associated protein Cas2